MRPVRWWLWLLCLAVVAVAGCAASPTEEADIEPAVTEPRVTEPRGTEPAVTEPRVTEPEQRDIQPGVIEQDGFRLFLARPDQVDLVWRDAAGEPYGQLESARLAVEAEGRTVHLVLNAGIYRPGQVPVGLHIEDGTELVPLDLDGETATSTCCPTVCSRSPTADRR